MKKRKINVNSNLEFGEETKKRILIGRHVSFASPDYLLGSAKEAVFNYNSNSFMIYLGSPQNSLREKNLEILKAGQFQDFLLTNKIDIKNVIVHASYLVNLADFENSKKLLWSIDLLASDMQTMNQIGLKTIVIHPGNSLKLDKKLSLFSVSKSIDTILKLVPNVKIAIETMSGSGTQLGKSFDEIKTIIENCSFKERVGVCWDTCHLYSAGYDLKNNFELILQEFDEKIGIKKLWVMHLNDSLFNFNSRRDRHCNIGYGFIGLECLALIAHHKKLRSVIKILETPTKNSYHKLEIEVIKSYNPTQK